MLSLGSGGAKSTKPSFVSYVTPEVSESFRVSIISYLRCFQNNPEEFKPRIVMHWAGLVSPMLMLTLSLSTSSSLDK